MYRFKDGSVVCFFGDSITFHGWWIRRIYDYYRNVLGIKCEMYNCGVPGNTSGRSLGQMEETLLVYNPTDVVIMFGMNDVGCGLYESEKADGDIICERRSRIDTGFFNIKTIAESLKERGIRVSFCTPTPYDELSDFKTAHRREGTQSALRELSCRIKQLAGEFGDNVVDFNGEMYEIMRRHYKKDLSVINDDRVHPSELGHELMAQIFLKSQGLDVVVDECFDNLEKLSLKEYDSWEVNRFELEKKNLENSFLYWCMYGTVKSDDTIRQIIKNYPEGKADEFLVNCFDTYLKSGKNIKSNLEKMIQYTKTIYTKN